MNIEKTISEHAVSDILTPMLESQDRIVTEDVAPLFDEATGLDTPTASGTVTTTIEESRSVITAIIRKAWTAPLTMLGGASVISYIAAAYTYLRNRLQGNETYGIPDRRSEISASSPLAANLALLNDRKIGGVPEAEDGMSMARVLCDSAVGGEITQLLDETKGWTMNRTIPSLFGTLTKIKLGCSVINEIQISTSAELIMDELKTTNRTGTWHAVFNYDGEKLSFPNLDTINGYVGSTGVFAQGNYKELYIPKVTRIYDAPGNHGCFLGAYQGRDSRYLRKLVVGKLTSFSWNFGGYYNTDYDSNLTNFIHFEIGQDTAISLNCAKWNPTNALDASRTDLIEEGSTAQNNLQQFLQNFRSVLFTRLAQRTSTTSLTLTLSPAVYKAVYGLDADYNVDPNALAQTASLGDLGIATEDLNEIEIAAGITTATKYATWLDTYRGAIYWNIGHA